MPLVLYTPAPVRRCVSRNNLFLGTGGNYAFETTAPMLECDFDYDGFGGGPWNQFLRWNGVRYATLAEVREKAPVYRHAVELDAAQVFASALQPPTDVLRVFDARRVDARLRPGTPAVDAGERLPGFDQGMAGRAPDLGAQELGAELPRYGPRAAAVGR
jgi:hypothetical protein